MKIFKTRNNLIDKLPKNLKIDELSVFRGDFAKHGYPTFLIQVDKK
jgi:hypothetical protein